VKPNSLLPTLLAAGLLAGCAGPQPEPIIEYRTVEVVRDRYVQVPEWMTVPVEIIELAADFDLYELGAVSKAREVRLDQCNGQLAKIAELAK